jgi:hypothetical protein
MTAQSVLKGGGLSPLCPLAGWPVSEGASGGILLGLSLRLENKSKASGDPSDTPK